MKAKTMNQGIGLAVTRLLNWAEGQGFQLTVSPIQVEAGTGKDWMVTLRACRQDGADIQARLGVDVMGEIIPNALRTRKPRR